jgi:hypothetical protein
MKKKPIIGKKRQHKQNTPQKENKVKKKNKLTVQEL